MTDGLVVEEIGHVCVLRLDRAESRNALTPAILVGLGAEILRSESSEMVRCIVLTGTGDRAFCSGMDLAAFASGDAAVALDGPEMRAFLRLLRGAVEVPVVGAANGTAVGGGLELLLGCDVVVASAEARFGLPEVKRGLIPGGGGTAITRRIPYALAMELLLTGDLIAAGRAEEMGLVNTVVTPDQVMPTAMALAERIAANGPLAVRAAKELGRLAALDADRWEQRLAELQPVVFASADAREGAQAFLERRSPDWIGH